MARNNSTAMNYNILSKFRSKILVIEDFFDADLCRELRAEALANTNDQARVYRRGVTEVDHNVRSTQVATMDTPAMSLVKTRLLEFKPELEKHFNVTLEGCRKPHCLLYRAHDFFMPHRDNNHDPLAHEEINSRRISIVIFLNGASKEPAPGAFGGGELAFYGLMDDPRCQAIAFPLIGKPGLLIAFVSELMHEVAPITHGERYTVVSWFY